MEIRPTRMLKWTEVQEDLGISKQQLINFVELGILNPIYLGNGWKFQKDYAGLDVSNYEKAKDCKKIVDAQRKLLQQGGISWKRN